MIDSTSCRHWLARLAAVAVLGAAGSANAADTVVAAAPASAAAREKTLEDLGIQFVGLQLTAESFMIDLRYRVTDPAKSAVLVDQKIRPVLVNERTGDRYYVPQAPKIGSLRQTATPRHPVQTGKVYFMLFANPDRRLQVGEKVTLYAGDAVLKGLVVR